MALGQLFQDWRDRLVLLVSDPDPAHQAGAIPYTVLDGQVVFLIITSRRSGRWIFPKGAPVHGMRPWELAAHEAFEEAGVEGEIEHTPIGTYRTMKTIAIRRKSIEVDLYPLRVTRQRDDWPEKGSRYRHWVLLPEARRLLSDKKLAELAARLSRRVLAQAQPTRERISA